jgi:hypothetical protein
MSSRKKENMAAEGEIPKLQIVRTSKVIIMLACCSPPSFSCYEGGNETSLIIGRKRRKENK